MFKKHSESGRKGFTLVEVIAVLVLLGILASLSVVGITSYIDYAEYKENTEYARMLFISTQSAMTHYRASGRLAQWRSTLQGATTDGADSVPVSAVQNADYARRLSYALINRGDADGGVNGTAIRELLDDYVYDKSAFDASICVEFDPVDGVVYSVLYSKQATAFTYADTAEAGTISIGSANRRYEVRRALRLGYYDTELSTQAPATSGKPVINSVRLVNGDTLELQWALSTLYKTRTQDLNYTVSLYDETGTERICFVVNTKKDDSGTLHSGSGMWEKTITCPYTANASDGTARTGEMTFFAYVDGEYVIHLVLDALDLKAAQAGVDYQNTASAMRLSDISELSGLSCVYARIQASGANYTASTWKQSSTESLLFGTGSSAASRSYNIQNSRHLFNLRFAASPTDAAARTFTQTASFAWNGDGSLFSRSGVLMSAGDKADLSNTSVATDSDAAFEPISLWCASNTLDASRNTQISNLRLLAAGASGDGFGLFLRNEGNIKNVSLKNCTVTAENMNKVGTFAGVNAGSIANVATVGGTVRGGNYTGGIFGCDETDGAVTYTGLTNGALVYGKSYVGGITSQINSGDTITGGTNNAAVRSTDASGVCVGGIVGHCFGGRIDGCKSSPAMSQTVFEDSDFKGKYVGGIVGLNQSGTVTGCSTGAGTVLGNEYVGGIVGLNAMGATAQLDGQNAYNRADVAGNRYVGGIVGANVTATASDAVNSLAPDMAANENIKLENWKNAGIVCARIEYGGGITGYNAGELSNCIADVDTSSVSGASRLAEAERLGKKDNGKPGDYIGGVAGYNLGKINNSSVKNVNCVVYGRDFVGGIVGCNAPDAQSIVNYGLTGGYIEGRCFVGGYAGLNCAANLFDADRALTAKPNSVDGKYFVGGITGGNIIKTDDPVKVNGTVDNFLGTIKGTAYVGGFFGYNALVRTSADDSYAVGRAEALAEAADKATLADAVAHVDTVGTGMSSKASTAVMTIGKWNSANYFDCRLKSLDAKVYVGGVIGGNAPDTRLNIEKIRNHTPVRATASLTDAAAPEDYYSYAGGIVGIATKYVVIDDCENANTAVITHEGKYIGGLVELNKGTIRRCTLGALGTSARSNIGGVAGVNENVITVCTVTNAVTGKDNVGGIVSLNRGPAASITDVCIKGTVTGYGDYVGGVAARSEGGEISGAVLENSVTSSGSYVGGAAGMSKDTVVRNCTMAGTGLTVSGASQVGGFIGRQGLGSGSAAVLEGLVNTAYVNTTGSAGFAGGIVGYVEGALTVRSCVNSGKVKANYGDAGGVTSHNGPGSLIVSCTDTAEVEAFESENNGFIAGVNDGEITGCGVSGTMSITGKHRVGGIVGRNGSTGKINNCTVTGITVVSLTGYNGCRLGGVAGDNAGTITACAGSGVTVTNNGINSFSGGVTGYNSGTVSGAAEKTRFGADVTLAAGQTGAVGGIAGFNTATGSGKSYAIVENYCFTGTVKAPGDTEYGIGGIAGVNGTGISGGAGLIRGCSVDNTVSGMTRTATHTENTAYTVSITAGAKADFHVGGIAGANSLYSEINSSAVEAGYIHGVYGMVGGVAGYNAGDITGCVPAGASAEKIAQYATATDANDTTLSLKVKLYLYQGHLGGLVGYNATTGLVKESATGFDWYVLVAPLISNKDGSTDDTCAGMIGYNISDKLISSNTNCADVHKALTGNNSDIASGGIGRQENQTSTAWAIENCVNYGDISGKARVGGMIGHWKYNGGTIRNCANYGDITGNIDGAGGMVGCILYASPGQEMYITGCRNFGSVKGKYEGGMVGWYRADNDGLHLYIIDCDNAGAVGTNSADRGGMVGLANKNSKKEVTLDIQRCINYYKFSSGAAMLGTNKSAELKIYSCIDAANSKTHVRGTANDYNNYINYYLDPGNAANSTGLRPLHVADQTAGQGSGTGYKWASNNSVTGAIYDMKYNPVTTVSSDAGYNLVSTNPHQAYEDLGIEIRKFYSNQNTAAPVTPTNVKLTAGSGAYTASWNDMGAFSYSFKLQKKVNASWTDVAGSEKTVTVGLSTDITMDELSAWGVDPGDIVRAAVAAVNGGGVVSAYGESPETTVLAALPQPKLSFELVTDGAGTSNYVARLANLDEYTALTAGAGAVSASDIIIKYSVGGTEKNFAVQAILDGEVKASVLDGGGGGNAIFIVSWAEPGTAAVGSYMASGRVAGQTQNYRVNYVRDNAFSSWSSLKLTGVTPAALRYSIWISQEKGQVYRRTEFVVYKDDFGGSGVNGVPVVISSNDPPNGLRVTAGHSITLAGIGELQGGERYTVRSYSWTTQSYLLNFGHAVAEKVSVSSLTDTAAPLKDKLRNEQIVFDNTTGLAPGYVLERNTDGTYNVYFSIVLYCSAVASPGDDQEKISKNQLLQVKATATDAVNVSVTDMTAVTVNGGPGYEFNWTSDAGRFDVTVRGKVVDTGNIVIIYSDQSGSTAKTLTLPASGWNYTDVTIEVSAYGTEDSNGLTAMGTTVSRTFSGLPLALPRVELPSVGLKAGNGNDELIYTVSFTPYASGTAAADDVERYVVYASPTNADPAAAIVTGTSTGGSVDLDLDALQGKSIVVYVTGEVKDAGVRAYSRDSARGVEYAMTVPMRKQISPSVLMNMSPKYVDDSFAVSISEFSNPGFTVVVTDTNAGEGTYTYEGGIYSSAATDTNTGAPTGALLTAALSGSLSNTDGNSMREASASFGGFSAEDYAGKYLALRFRAKGSSEISSYWTPYSFFRLPLARVDTPTVDASRAERLEYAVGSGTDTIFIDLPTFEWGADTVHAKGYGIDITLNPGVLATGTSLRLETLTSGTDAPQVTLECDGLGQVPLGATPTDAGGVTTYVYEIPQWRFIQQVNVVGATVEVCARMEIAVDNNSGSITYRLIRPDYTRYYDVVNNGYDGGGGALTVSASISARAITGSSFLDSGPWTWTWTP